LKEFCKKVFLRKKYTYISCVMYVCLCVCGFQWFNSVSEWVRKIIIINKSLALDNNHLPSLSLLQRSGVCSLFSATSVERRIKLLGVVRSVYVVEEGRKGGREEGGGRKGGGWGVTRGFWEWSGSGSRGRMRG
jgi:hypothetical protein